MTKLRIENGKVERSVDDGHTWTVATTGPYLAWKFIFQTEEVCTLLLGQDKEGVPVVLKSRDSIVWALAPLTKELRLS